MFMFAERLQMMKRIKAEGHGAALRVRVASPKIDRRNLNESSPRNLALFESNYEECRTGESRLPIRLAGRKARQRINPSHNAEPIPLL